MMTGWKTWAGAACIAGGEVLIALGMPDVGEPLKQFGMVLMGIGVAHKIEKASK